MAQYGFFFDGTRCTGCKTCEFACKDYKDLTTEFAFRKVYEVAGGETTRDEDGLITTTAFSYPVSSSCQHCDKPACVEACPTGAMHKDEETGLVTVDTEVCIGCGACATACPYKGLRASFWRYALCPGAEASGFQIQKPRLFMVWGRTGPQNPQRTPWFRRPTD